MLEVTGEVNSAPEKAEDAFRYFGHEDVTVIEPARGWRSLDLRRIVGLPRAPIRPDNARH